MDKLAEHKGSLHDLDRIERLNRLLQASSHCGLGHTACNPVVDTLKRFRPAYERRLRSTEFEPAFDLDGALERARAMTGRDDAGAHFGAAMTAQPMSDAAPALRPTFLLDGDEVPFEPGETVMQAALAAGHYIPHLCYHPEFKPHGSCKVCTVRVGQTVASCTLPAQAGMRSSARARNSRRTGARWCRCCSSRATTSARRARRAATACCRRWPTTSAC